MLKFVGIGAQKAGTTWIAEHLARHPDVAFPAGKEVHFWDWHYERGIDWYQNLFTDPSKIEGDITPAYAFMSVEKIKELHAVYPDLRLIYSVRNPIDRAWSAARMMVKRAELTMKEASDAWFIDLFRSQGSRNRGDYVRAVDSWLSVFDESQLLVVDFEHIKHDPLGLITQCCEHIGIDAAMFVNDSDALHAKVHKSVGSTAIRPSLLPVLHELYDKQIETMQAHPVLGNVFRGE